MTLKLYSYMYTNYHLILSSFIIKKSQNIYPNITISLRIVLTIPATV